MINRNFRLVLIISIINFSFGYSQGFLRTQGKVIINENQDTILLRGIGLGGWMLQEGYMLQTASFANPQYQIREKIEELIGKEDADAFYEAWLANHVRRADIDSLKSWGFNSVRLPMHYNLFTLPIELEPIPGEHTWLEKGFVLTDSIISWCKANEMYVIFDLHAAPGGQGKDEGISDYDPSKPSLWESSANRDKTVALWRRLAETYKDEPWVGGYDLINEPNWPMDQNVPLRDLYGRLTDTIRAIDQNHILFIEGNWFANDFTGLTPPWDENMVYSPHKYWSFNDQASIQWVLDLRNAFDLPLYFGEWGENSNDWFTDAVKLFENNNIGWAYWPMKKVESIAGPLSVIKTAGYQSLLDYWEGNGPAPSAEVAKNILMDLTEKLKIENCIYQKGVVDALFRRVQTDEAIPFNTQNIPGIVYATEYDLGGQGVAYFDEDIADFRVSTGIFTAWNQGWSYRNDGVDIEATEEQINSNGWNVGWLNAGEWMQYDINVMESAVYEVNVRVAANAFGGQFHLAVGDVDVTSTVDVPNSEGWQNWQTVTIPSVILEPSDQKLRFYVDKSGFNLSSIEFVQKEASVNAATSFVSANTLDEYQVQLSLNKPMNTANAPNINDFQILINNNPTNILAVNFKTGNTRSLVFEVEERFRSSQNITISYTGNGLSAIDGIPLTSFTQQPVKNTVAIVHSIPGRIEAEDFFFQSGIQLENTSDAGGGENIGFLDAGDYLDYLVIIPQAGTYEVNYRTAALSESGQVQLSLIDEDGNAAFLHTATFPPTGGWQDWTNSSQPLVLPEGEHQLRMTITQPLFNVNWMEFSLITSVESNPIDRAIQVAPNPSKGIYWINGQFKENQTLRIKVVNSSGVNIGPERKSEGRSLNEKLDLTLYPNGVYWILIYNQAGIVATRKILKVDE